VKNVESTLKLALEIIHDINMKRHPNPETIRKLEVVTSPKPENMSLDEWVCEAIREAMQKKRASSSAPKQH
jgi:hypothetical protein